MSAQTIFLVRHAERADVGAAAQHNPALSEAGKARAQALTELLRDAKLEAIYVTEYRRTQETAQPLARKLGIQPIVVPARATAQLVAKLKSAHGNVLVIGHSNTLPEIIQSLGVAAPPVIGEREYDHLFLLERAPSPRLIHLHYHSPPGEPL